jgi:hypothetical protein
LKGVRRWQIRTDQKATPKISEEMIQKGYERIPVDSESKALTNSTDRLIRIVYLRANRLIRKVYSMAAAEAIVIKGTIR